MIHHEDKELVFKRPRPEQAAMNVGGWTPARQRIEDHVGALEHEHARAFRELAVVADHNATTKVAGWCADVPDRELRTVAPAAAGFMPVNVDLAHDTHQVARRGYVGRR